MWGEILAPRAFFTIEESQILGPGISQTQQSLNPKVSIGKLIIFAINATAGESYRKHSEGGFVVGWAVCTSTVCLLHPQETSFEFADLTPHYLLANITLDYAGYSRSIWIVIG